VRRWTYHADSLKTPLRRDNRTVFYHWQDGVVGAALQEVTFLHVAYPSSFERDASMAILDGIVDVVVKGHGMRSGRYAVLFSRCLQFIGFRCYLVTPFGPCLSV
jgi:hypothetical protein